MIVITSIDVGSVLWIIQTPTSGCFGHFTVYSRRFGLFIDIPKSKALLAVKQLTFDITWQLIKVLTAQTAKSFTFRSTDTTANVFSCCAKSAGEFNKRNQVWWLITSTKTNFFTWTSFYLVRQKFATAPSSWESQKFHARRRVACVMN